jgi:hypothetical protein
MKSEAVFYFDVLGFRQMADTASARAVDVLGDLAALLQDQGLSLNRQKWHRRYALSDSVFLTHGNATTTLVQASDLVFNLFQLTRKRPFLLRGGIAYGKVQHVKGVFLTSKEPANLVGSAVVEAVQLEQSSGLKGPRILLSERLARSVKDSIREWLLRPTSAAGVWEVLWLLPSRPSEVAEYQDGMLCICETALDLARFGGQPTVGAHYREFLLLMARCLTRLRKFVGEGRVRITIPLARFLPADKVRRTLDAISGVPDEYCSSLLTMIDSLSDV